MEGLARRPHIDPQFRRDVLNGLAAPIPAVPARWLYNHRGSELFEVSSFERPSDGKYPIT